MLVKECPRNVLQVLVLGWGNSSHTPTKVYLLEYEWVEKNSEVAEKVWSTDCQVNTGELLLLPMPRGLKPAHKFTRDSVEYQISNMSDMSGAKVAYSVPHTVLDDILSACF